MGARLRATLCAVLAVLLAVAAWLAMRAGRIPKEWNPATPLEVSAPLGLFTRYKLWRLGADGDLCRHVLGGATMTWQPLADREIAPGCGFHDAVEIERTSLAVAETFSLSCRTAVALALWERHVVQPAARRHFGEPVTTLEHFGSYSCRNVYGRKVGRRSLHATADAIDVAGFVLASGRRIRIVNDWPKGDDAARFLRDVHEGACRVFDAVLGPGYNEAHRDHFHLDRGAYHVCR